MPSKFSQKDFIGMLQNIFRTEAYYKDDKNTVFFWHYSVYADFDGSHNYSVSVW